METTHKDGDSKRGDKRQVFRIGLLNGEHEDVIKILNDCSQVMRPTLIVDAIRYFQSHYVPSLIGDSGKERPPVPSEEKGTLGGLFRS